MRMIGCVVGALTLAIGNTALAEDFSSKALSELAESLGDDSDEAVAQFWATCGMVGTPLIEPREDDENYANVTFLYMPGDDVKRVSVSGAFGGSPLEERTLAPFENTKLLYKTFRMRRDTRISYEFAVVPFADSPHADGEMRFEKDTMNPKKSGNASLLELDRAPKQVWRERIREAPRGDRDDEPEFASEILGNRRTVSVCLPPGYSEDHAPYGVFYVFDRDSYLTSVPTPLIMDNLLYKKRIPPMVTVLIGNGPDNARGDELPCNPKFAEFMAAELVPWVRERYHVSTDPADTVIGGSSYGALAASYCAFQHPELFGNVLSQSGSYWWSKSAVTPGTGPDDEGEWLSQAFAHAPKKPIRFYMVVGLYEGGNPSMRVVNRHFRNVLHAKGYEIVDYTEYSGGHEYTHWRGSLGEGLIALMGK